MPQASDLVAYASANMPDSDSATSGGAIDTKRRIDFTQMVANDTIEAVSTSASDTQNLTIEARKADGSVVSETKALTGTTAISFSTLGTVECILKADLAVKAQATDIGDTGKLSCATDPATQARSERLEQTLIVPEVAKAVNTDPAYAPIRRAFLARVVAQWIRKRHGDGHRTSFDGLIGSGDLGSAQLTDGWRPRQVYDSYVRSIQNGDFTFTRTVERGGVRMRMRIGSN